MNNNKNPKSPASPELQDTISKLEQQHKLMQDMLQNGKVKESKEDRLKAQT